MSAEQIYQAMMELPQKERFDLVARLLAEDTEKEEDWLDPSFLRYPGAASGRLDRHRPGPSRVVED